MIEAVVGKIDIHPVARAEIELDHALAPGMKYRHYAPEAKLVLIEPSAVHKIDEVVEQYRKAGAKTAVIRNTGSKAEFARNLFSALRDYDRMGYDVVVVEGTDEEGLGLAIMNRLRKAASVILK
jgi:L-threonylcarbamoyladenylate synthase